MKTLDTLPFKTAIVQFRPILGDIRATCDDMIVHIGAARGLGAQIVVFVELAPTGYLLGDRWEYESFLREAVAANERIRAASHGLIVVWGSVRVDWDRIGEDGRVRKYNAALIAQDGEWISNGVLSGWIPKTNLPKYRMFDDARHFYPADKLAAEKRMQLWDLLRPFDVEIDGVKMRLGLAVCEDLWEDEYLAKVSKIHRIHGVDLLIDISHSPWTARKWRARDTMLKKRSLEVGAPILYINSVGLQNNGKNLIWFDGGSLVVDQTGTTRWAAPTNVAGMSIIDLAKLQGARSAPAHPNEIEEKRDAIIAAMREFYCRHKRVVIGLSGGIDSAVSLAMHVEALGPERVLAVNMPSHFNSKTTQLLAKLCASNFGVEYRIVPIQPLLESELRTYKTAGMEAPSQFDLENIQARLRGHVLAAMSAMQATELGGPVTFTCNGNKTEVALNYFTLYGDGAGGSAFFGDLWKGEMYELAELINKRAGHDVIPQGIIDIVPSAELSADQDVDKRKGDPIFYPFHDRLLQAFIERRIDPTIIMRFALAGTLDESLGCAPGTVAKHFPTREALVASIEWAWKQFSYEGKRHMLPPVFITSRRAFGFDRRETIAPGFETHEYASLRERFLHA